MYFEPPEGQVQIDLTEQHPVVAAIRKEAAKHGLQFHMVGDCEAWVFTEAAQEKEMKTGDPVKDSLIRMAAIDLLFSGRIEKARKDIPAHPFQGDHDRPCLVCGLSDYNLIHTKTSA